MGLSDFMKESPRSDFKDSTFPKCCATTIVQMTELDADVMALGLTHWKSVLYDEPITFRLAGETTLTL